jgi:hypothetical protein
MMTRNLKTLGLALLATFAMSAVLASAASATNDVFRSESSPMIFKGEQVSTAKFTLAGQAVECTTASYEATATGTLATEIKTISPNLNGCTFGGGEAPIHLNGCKLNFTGTTDVNGDAQVSIVDCNAEKSIEVTLKALQCIITLKAKGAADGNQVAEEGVRYTNDGAGATRGVLGDLTIKFKLSSTPEAGKGEGVTCASLTNNTGTLDGTVTITGQEDKVEGAHVGLWTE